MGAQFIDFSPAHARERAARRAIGKGAQQDTVGVFSDMADGVLALDFALTLGRCPHDARKLDLSIVGLLGDGQTSVEMFDKELAGHIKCSDRTVRRYRADAIKARQTAYLTLIHITEGEYLPDQKLYAPTRYELAPGIKAFVEATIAQARRSPEYATNRRAAIEKAATDNYNDIPDAPPALRSRKPKRRETLQIERDFVNADRNLAKGQRTLDELSDRTRAAFLAGKQGEDLRLLLVKMQAEISELLQVFPQTVDEIEVEQVPDKLSGTPPASDSFVEGVTGAAVESEFGVRVEEEKTRTQDFEPDAAACEAWDDLSARLNAPRARTVEVEIRGKLPNAGRASPLEAPRE